MKYPRSIWPARTEGRGVCRVPADWTITLISAQLAALNKGGIAALAQNAAGPFTQGQVTAGRADYLANCAGCHTANLVQNLPAAICQNGVESYPCARANLLTGQSLHAHESVKIGETRPVCRRFGEGPENLAVQQRLGIADSQLKNHIRCVALSPDKTRCLMTVVYEAWCITLDGEIVWGVKMPVKEGYSPAGAAERQADTSDQVSQALAILGLALPVSSDDVKRTYRELAKQYHPDLNGGDRRSLEKMKELILAVEAVTGLTAEAVPEFTGVRYSKELQRSAIKTQFGTLNISMQMVVSETFAALIGYDRLVAKKCRPSHCGLIPGEVPR